MSFGRKVAALVALLAAQGGLAAWTWRASTAEVAVTPLFPFSPAEVDAVTVSSRVDAAPGGAPISLVRGASGWRLASAGGYPAASATVDEVLRRLVGAPVQAPVATRPESHDALHVGADSYERRVELHAGDRVAVAWLGTTTAGALNVRVDARSDVYTLRGLSVFDLGPEARVFTAPAALDLDAIVSFELRNTHGELRLRREGEAWVSSAPVDARRAAALVRRATKLRLVAPVGTEDRPEYGLDGAVHVGWTLADGTTGGYVAGNPTGVDAWWRLDGSPYVAVVSGLPMTSVRSATLADLAP